MKEGNVEIPEGVELRIVRGENKGELFDIKKKSVTIGRASECDIVLNDSHVSHKHFQIVYRNGHFTAIDLGSLNKTKINDTVYVQKNISNGDVITAGATQFKFIQPEETS